MKKVKFILVAVLIIILPSLSNAKRNSWNFSPAKDNTIYYNNGTLAADSLSNGAGGSFVAGTVNTPNYYRRALIYFDLSRLAGRTVDSAVLKIRAQQNARLDSTARHFTLHKLNQDWKQGDSEAADPGRGTQAQTDDATWKWSVYPNSLWTTEGGNFVETASATTGTLTNLLNTDVYWRSSVSGNARMKTDVQNWINNPSTNFGWLIKGIEGTDLRKATMFYSRESATYPPKLTVYYH